MDYPRQKMLRRVVTSAEQDVAPDGDNFQRYKALALQHGAGNRVHHDIEKYVYAKDIGLAKRRGRRPGPLRSGCS